MPDERLIQEIENILSDVVALGGQRERTSIVPNMLVRDASPTGQDDYVIIADNRDNDNILALKIPGIVYADNNLVNVIFPEGGEAIAFQQGSGSTTSGLWDIVPSTSTDIYYNKGNVGISTDSPDYSLQIGDGASSVALAAGENIQFIGPNTASGRLILEGTAQADIILIDGGAGADDKAMQLFTDGGLTKFRSFTDAAGVQSDNILVMDHGNGNVGLGTAGPGDILHIVDGTSDIIFGQVAAGFGGVAFDSTITLANYALIGDGTDVFLNTPTGGTKFFRENNVNQAVLLHTSGNFGLGDAAPDSKIVSSYNAWVGPAAVSGDTVQNSSYMEEGLVINSGAAKEMIALKDPAVAHGMTTNAETDTFGSLLVSTGFLGGLSIIGYSEDQLANTIIGRAASGSTTKGTSALAPVTLNAQKKSGTTVTAMAADENLVTISNGLVSPQTKWILDADGDSWQQGSITLGTNIIHDGDTDTYIGFTADDIEFFAGGISMLKLTEAGQDVVDIGDVAGTGDVDIDFNDGQMFLQGSDGRVAINTAIDSEVRLNIIDASTTTGSRDLALHAEIDTTNNTTAVYVSHGVRAINRYRGTQGSTSPTGPNAYVGQMFNYNTGTTTKISGFRLDQRNLGVGTVSNMAGIQIDTMQNSGGGAVTSTFGVRIEAQTVGTNNFGIYQIGSGSDNYLGGSLGVGVVSPLAKTHIDQSSTTAAIPTLSLDQADLSEEFINFISTIGAGNPIDTAAIGTYYGKIRVAVNGTFKYMALYNS